MIAGMPYFTELDSYYNYRLTENYLKTGHLGDTQINGTDWDSLSTSPHGREANYQPVIIVLAAWVYKFVNMFGNVSLTQIAILDRSAYRFISSFTCIFHC